MDADSCVVCSKCVRGRQHALQCDKCDRWTHRLCGTGITLETYRSAVRGNTSLDFICRECVDIGIPQTESTRLSEVANVSSNQTVTYGNFSVGIVNLGPLSPQRPPPISPPRPSTPPRSPTPPRPSTPQSPRSPPNSPASSPLVLRRKNLVPLDYSSDEDIVSPDSSFEITRRSFEQPDIVEEESIQDDTVNSITHDDDDIVRYFLIDAASQRGQQKLADSLGFTYNRKRKRGQKIDWQCSVRNQNVKCPATVIQNQENFVRGKSNHVHPATPGIKTAIVIKAQVKKVSKENIFQSATAIVEDALLQHVSANEPEASRPSQGNLVRIANRTRQRLRPEEPTSMDFEVAHNFIPAGFFRKDVKVEGHRHIIFATDDQLEVLSKAKTWYLDGTFKVVREPFVQLFTVHAFLKSGDEMKQVPLAFVMMSRRRQNDYKKVLKKLKRLLPSEPRVKEMVTDFEAAIWKGIKDNFPDVIIRGCAYHWTQAIWRKIQELGMQVAYQNDDSAFKFLRKVMALPFLPKEHVQSAFRKLSAKAVASPIVSLLDYVNRNWLVSNVWSVDKWCVFDQPIRTNNDVEGWHRRLNHKARESALPFYVLVPLLHKEASLLPIQRKLVSEGKLSRYQRSKTLSVQARLFEVWNAYKDDELTACQLLRECGKINGPVIDE